MKRITLAFLTLLMLTPTLACGVIMSTQQAQAASEAPCHGKQETDQQNPLMTFKDCTNVDLQAADYNTTVKKPDVQIDKVFFAWANIAPKHSFTLVDIYQIRGPPFGASPPHFNNHDLYLTTQRLRV